MAKSYFYFKIKTNQLVLHIRLSGSSPATLVTNATKPFPLQKDESSSYSYSNVLLMITSFVNTLKVLPSHPFPLFIHESIYTFIQFNILQTRLTILTTSTH